MSIKVVKQITVSEIFPNNALVVYRIPKYQREYTWGKYSWDALFTDVIENENGYFLGAYICVNSSSLGTPVLELIDGQQRFVTLSILLVVLYEQLCDYIADETVKEEDKLTSEDITEVNNLRCQLANKISERINGRRNIRFEQRLLLQMQNHNQDDFRYMLGACEILDEVPKPSSSGKRRIIKAYSFFHDQVDKFVEENLEEGTFVTRADALLYLVGKFNSAILVGIEVDTHQDAYMLFESLNNRGVPLSAIDLIKNLLIATADKEGYSTDDYYERWKAILNNLIDDYSVQERFFRQYYNAFRDTLNEPFKGADASRKYPLGPLATRTTLLAIYEKLIKKDLKLIVDDLSQKSKDYSVILNISDEDRLYKEDLLNLERVQGSPAYIMLLYILSNQKQLNLSDENIVSIVRYLVVFFVRRNITDIPNTRKLTKLFMDIIDAVKVMTGSSIVDVIKDNLMAVSAPDDLFVAKLNGPLYEENYDACRFVLCALEEQFQSKEIHTDLWAKDKSAKYVWTIEHIFPEGDNIPQEWVDMVADGDKTLAKSLQEEYVHTLGNLTITGYNSNLSNMSFDRKKNRKSRDGSKDIGYRNGLYLNADVVNQDEWKIANIKERTNRLVNEILKLFKW